jgi:hypothetical protein
MKDMIGRRVTIIAREHQPGRRLPGKERIEPNRERIQHAAIPQGARAADQPDYQRPTAALGHGSRTVMCEILVDVLNGVGR